MAKTQIKFKDAVVKEMPMTQDTLSICRKGGNDLVIDNYAVSGFHARILREDQDFVIEDLNSLNGTFLNGRKVSKCVLKNSDVVLIGNHTIEFFSEKPSDAETKRPV